MRRAVVCGWSVAATALLMGAAGQAAGASIVSFSVGQPTAENATAATARAVADSSGTRLEIRYRPTGGPPCALSPIDDPGQVIIDDLIGPGEETSTTSFVFPQAGSFVWCGWLRAGFSLGTVAQASGTVTVAAPTGTISRVQAPSRPGRGQPFVVAVTGRSGAPRALVQTLKRAAAGPCAAAPALEQAALTDLQTRPGELLGDFTLQVPRRIDEFGRYRLCTWIARNEGDLGALALADTSILVAPAPRTTTQVRIHPPRQERGRPRALPFRITALVQSVAGRPQGRCVFDRRVRGRFRQAAIAPLVRGKCRARVRARDLGITFFRVRYLPSNGFLPSSGISLRVVVRR